MTVGRGASRSAVACSGGRLALLVIIAYLPEATHAQLGCRLTFEDGTTQSFEHGDSLVDALPTVCGPEFPCFCENGQASCPLCTTQNADGNYVCAKDGETVTVVDTDTVLKECTCDFVVGTTFFWQCDVAPFGATATPVEPSSSAPTAAPVLSSNVTVSETPPGSSSIVTGNVTAPPAPQCRIQTETSECDALLRTLTTEEECDCYNFCTGEFMGCCDFDDDCDLPCKGLLVSGCTRDVAPPSPAASPGGSDDTLAPTVEFVSFEPPPTVPPQCRIQIGTSECDDLVQTTEEECDCYSFCNGEFSGCCDYGGPCSLSCSGTIVAGCTKSFVDIDGALPSGAPPGESPPSGGTTLGTPPSESPPSRAYALSTIIFLKVFEAIAVVGLGQMVL